MANNIATAVVGGRLTRDAELNESGKVLRFSVASNYPVKNGDSWDEDVSFFECKILGERRAGAMEEYLTQGRAVVVHGALRQERWENQEGDKRSKVVILADTVELGAMPRGGSDSDAGGDDDDAPF